MLEPESKTKSEAQSEGDDEQESGEGAIQHTSAAGKGDVPSARDSLLVGELGMRGVGHGRLGAEKPRYRVGRLDEEIMSGGGLMARTGACLQYER